MTCAFSICLFFFLAWNAAMFRLLLLEKLAKGVELLIPIHAEVVHPLRDLGESLQLGFAVAFAAAAVDGHDAALGQDPDVPGDGGAAHLEVLRNSVKGEGCTRD